MNAVVVTQTTLTPPQLPSPSSQLNHFWELPSAQKSHSTFLPGIAHSRQLEIWGHPDQHPCLRAELHWMGLLSSEPSIGLHHISASPSIQSYFFCFLQVFSPHGTHQQITTHVFLLEFFPRETDLSQLLKTQVWKAVLLIF